MDSLHSFNASPDQNGGETQPVNTEPDAFLQMLVGMRPLVRRDIPLLGLCGLFDSETKEWFVVEESQLFSQRETQPRSG